jgi:hypothetical protein
MTVRNATRLLLAALTLVPAAARAQGTLDDYQRASTIAQRYNGLATGIASGVEWNGNQATYRVSVTGGNQFVVVDADAWTKQPAFDHARLATSLSRAADASYTAITLPFTSFEYVNGRQAITFDAGANAYRCTLSDYACTRTGAATQPQGGFGPGRGGAQGGRGGAGGPPPGGRGGQGAGQGAAFRVSPDGKWHAVVQNYNIGIRAADGTGSVTMLSTDGKEGDPYQLGSIQWAPDSRKFVAYRTRPGLDHQIHYIQSSPTTQVQPIHSSNFYQKAGDQRDRSLPVIFNVETRQQLITDTTLFANAYQISRPIWRKDGAAFAFEFNQRGHMVYRILEVNAANAQVRPIINEETKSFFAYRGSNAELSDVGHNWNYDVGAACNLSNCGGGYSGGEMIWMSERDGWNHLYLYDEATGKVKNQITKGAWPVKHVDSVDVAKRQIYFTALGMNKDQDPYFRHYYRINFDGTGLVAYTEANGNHTITWSPDRKYYIDTYSRVDMPPVIELKRASDRKTLALEKGDYSAMTAAGWSPPEVFVAKGRDGVTDIWGIIVKPITFDPSKKYPVIEYIYAGPQGSFVPKNWGGGNNFIPLAEIGFIYVQIDGMGTNNRSKAFHDVAWKNLADAGFPDRILWHQAVAKKYAWYDVSRVGIYGSSAGGQNAAGAVMFHPEFYDAAFASSGCHDNRMDKIWWNEMWMGELGDHYAANSNVTAAKNLKGHLFLAAGEMDTNVDPATTMQVVNALILAHKDFDLLIVPNGGHGALGPDGNRKRNDFFVRHLLGVNPPDWNSGLVLERTGGRVGFEFPADEEPAYGFFDSPEDLNPPGWWW